MSTDLREIKKDKQIIKFCFYGFLKNLRFFDPFLIIYFLSMDLSLFKVGALYSIREIFNYIFEIPSGLFADNYGKKTELYLCFILYIISFIFFFIGGSFWILVLAMIFFGLGEAFRSGTHKGMILYYLEEKNWFSLKSFVYGRTRSFSLLGSSLSAFLSIVFVLGFGSIRILFLLCILPYLINFGLIISYPKRFNEKVKSEFKLKDFFKTSVRQIKTILKNIVIIKTVLSSASFDAIFKTIKDYIQPILQMVIVGSSVSLIKNMNADDTMSIYLALIYGAVYILSAMASKNVYILNRFKSSVFFMNLFFDLMAAAFVLLAVLLKINAVYLIIAVYFIFYILKDARKPLFVDVIGDCIKKSDSVTVLSIESQFRALFVAVLAPLFGFIADKLSISALFLIIGLLSFGINRFVKIKDSTADA